jgi:hypothetical protein
VTGIKGNGSARRLSEDHFFRTVSGKIARVSRTSPNVIVPRISTGTFCLALYKAKLKKNFAAAAH